MKIEKLGDVHNFGKFVTIEKSAIVHKPRNVFWEGFFFGIDSPILNYLETINSRFSKYKKIKIIENNLHESKVYFINEEVKKVKYSDLSLILENFMDLSAYCLYFGIMDLNVENIFHVNGCEFLVIDNELVLNDIPSLSATGLIPNRSMLYRKSGISKIFTTNYVIPDDIILKSLLRFNETFAIFLDHSEEIYQLLYKEKVKFSLYPNRIIIRNTSEYIDFLNDNAINHTFYPEELVQLQRGDVPYFFHSFSDKNFKYYINENMDSAWVSSQLLSFYYQGFVPSLPNIEYLKDTKTLHLKCIYSLLELFETLAILSSKENILLNAYEFKLEINDTMAIVSKLNFGSVALVRKYEDEHGNIEEDTRIKEIRGELISRPCRENSAFFRLD